MTGFSTMESFVETIGIAEVKDHLCEMLAEYFHPSEQSGLRQRPMESVAGRIALKTAISALARKHFPTLCLRPKDIFIEATPNGAPRIAEIAVRDTKTAALLKKEVSVSISHSRTGAAGMACICIEDIS